MPTASKNSSIKENSEINQSSLSLSVLVPVYNERYLVSSSISRLLNIKSKYLSEIEIVVVDDGSTDGTWDELIKIKSKFPHLKLFKHEKNQGKGAAVRTAVSNATKDACVIHDADMEYDPDDFIRMIQPFLEEGADAVFGSRFLPSESRRVLKYRHSLVNKIITILVNWATDLNWSDVETCYKMVKTKLLKSIPLNYNDFRFEVELTIKLAKRRVRIFEVPIRYLPRTREEGKKISFKDGFLTLIAIVRLWFVENLYPEKAYGLVILHDMNQARRFNKWMADSLKPYIGKRVLEIGAGIGVLTNHFIPRDYYVASDINKHALDYLKSYAIGKPYLEVMKIDACSNDDFSQLNAEFDTVVMINVLEHVPDEASTLNNLNKVLVKGGRAVILVPQFPCLYGSFDKVLGHRERYTKKKLKESLTSAGFEVQRIFDFNRTSVPSWYINAKMLKHKRFSRFQLKTLEIIMPLIKRIDRFIPWGGLSIIAVASKK